MENWLFISCKIFSNVLESKNEVSQIFLCLGIKFLAQEESVHCMRTVDNMPTEYSKVFEFKLKSF